MSLVHEMITDAHNIGFVGGNGHGNAFSTSPEDQLTTLELGFDQIPIHELAVEDIKAEWVEQQILNRALERTGPINRMVLPLILMGKRKQVLS